MFHYPVFEVITPTFSFLECSETQQWAAKRNAVQRPRMNAANRSGMPQPATARNFFG